MAHHKNALIRYRVLDRCFRNRQRKFSLQDLVDICSEALYEYEGKEESLSLRTIQYDIQLMRSEKIGYNAPIEVYEKKYYRYSNPKFSINGLHLSEKELKPLRQAVNTLKQFQHIEAFQLSPVILKNIENQFSQSANSANYIHFEQNQQLKGLEHFNLLFEAIADKKVLRISYLPFKSAKTRKHTFHPYFLKEYNGRWFLLGMSGRMDKLKIFALDRIHTIKESKHQYLPPENLDITQYFKNTIGVTVNPEIHLVKLQLTENLGNYVLSKPFHPTMKVIETLTNGSVIISIEVCVNYELKQLICSFAEEIKVLAPNHLREQIINKLNKARDQYAHHDKLH
ncbi:MAG: WYL domain-containing protein [Cyclobacteriaceae bacterium]|nr:WYL domain-containing protein [Cyclobacteriaceae bacterium]MCH8517892.1 WYL domain-containing protein [Cyclobacteriaceae bacterium]